ncbi:MAG: hypothetical protein BMS9Abin13_190 [Patescibacteria group bacterium]|nr:MAG: hypothetical protein BMS9Abin13_190 [Patescibacteria group bacterium]
MMDTKNILILLALGALTVAYVRYKEKIGQELVVAFLIAFFWTSYYHYEYIGNNIFLLDKINLYPLVLWTGGLVFLREVYERIAKWKFLSTVLLYWLVVVLIEAIGYYVLNIRLVTQYPDLFNLGIIHIPPVSQIFYIIIGPIYILVTDYLKVK